MYWSCTGIFSLISPLTKPVELIFLASPGFHRYVREGEGREEKEKVLFVNNA
jgi:hypothetical protein